MDFSTLITMSSEDRTSALALDFNTISDDDLTSALTERRAEMDRLFAIETPSIEEVDLADAIFSTIGAIEAEQTRRDEVAADAAQRFAAMRAQFNAAPEGTEAGDDTDSEDGDDTDAGDDGSDEGDATDEGTDAGEGDSEDGGVTTASGTGVRGRRVTPVSAARAVAKRTPRPAKPEAAPVTITAAAGVPGHNIGAKMNGMTDVALAAQGLASNFVGWDQNRAQALRSSGVNEQIVKVPLAQFSVPSTNDLTAKSGTAAEYDAVTAAVKAHAEQVQSRMGLNGEAALAAAMAWCSPSEVVYNWIADFVVDGLKRVPQISAPRGGLMLTEGPRLLQGTHQPNTQRTFGFGGTEAQMEAGYVKTCETIECPDFFDHRLDFDGYCWKIPILTESTFPELIADALRVSDVAYAHKMNMRLLDDIIANSVAKVSNIQYGGTVMDTIEALVTIATKERRWWNLGRNATMEVTLPDYALDIFKVEMQRRSGLALSDVATEQKINAYFANHNLSVEYVSDFDERATSAHPTIDWPNQIRAIIYPVGTFIQAQHDVIKLSAVHDAASLSQNEYTGVFYEQGIKTIRRGYRSTVVTIDVCTAGATGADSFTCDDFGSF